MDLNEFKILCIDKSKKTQKIIKGVFNSVPHSLQITDAVNSVYFDPLKFNFDLFVINFTQCDCTIDDIRRIKINFPDPAFIIIDENDVNIEQWSGFENLKYLNIKDIESKLPVFLGDFYSRGLGKFDSSFSFLKLLKYSLDRVHTFILITDYKSNIIFLNREAEKIFQFQDPESGEFQLIDYMIDGAKVWNYMTRHNPTRDFSPQHFEVTFTDNSGNNHAKRIILHKLSIDQDYFLLESADINPTEFKSHAGSEYDLLNKFADSIANELMNPVNNISGRIQLLQSEMAHNAKHKKSLESLEKQVNRINETMSKLLTFARLKQDTIPQKINVNDLVNKILMEPSIERLLKQHEIELEYNLSPDIPMLSGLISHFNLLIKNSLEICFACLGNKGRILVETKHLKDYLKQNWVAISFIIDFTESLMYKRGCLQDFFKDSNFIANAMSIESTIVNHIVHHYEGRCQFDTEIHDRESVSLLFPLHYSKNFSEDK